MNLQQLRYLCGVVEARFSVSRAAEALHTSQPGISKQIQLLEAELGVDILIRQGNRIIGLTDPGREIHAVAQRMLWDAANLKQIGDEYARKSRGRLVVGTTHVHARYVLLPVIKEFTRKYHDVNLELRQGNPREIAQWVLSGEADMGISATPPDQLPEDLVCLDCDPLPRSVITLPGHPLQKLKRLTLEKIAAYPLVTLDASFTGGATVIKAFAAVGLKPRIVMSAIDTDVIKAYVEIGHGIAILPSVAFDPVRDHALRAIDASHLFEPTLTRIELQRGKVLRGYMRDFIGMVHARWSETAIERALHNLRK